MVTKVIFMIHFLVTSSASTCDEGARKFREFNDETTNYALGEEVDLKSVSMCSVLCLQNPACVGFNYDQKKCQLTEGNAGTLVNTPRYYKVTEVTYTQFQNCDMDILFPRPILFDKVKLGKVIIEGKIVSLVKNLEIRLQNSPPYGGLGDHSVTITFKLDGSCEFYEEAPEEGPGGHVTPLDDRNINCKDIGDGKYFTLELQQSIASPSIISKINDVVDEAFWLPDSTLDRITISPGLEIKKIHVIFQTVFL